MAFVAAVCDRRTALIERRYSETPWTFGSEVDRITVASLGYIRAGGRNADARRTSSGSASSRRRLRESPNRPGALLLNPKGVTRLEGRAVTVAHSGSKLPPIPLKGALPLGNHKVKAEVLGEQ